MLSTIRRQIFEFFSSFMWFSILPVNKLVMLSMKWTSRPDHRINLYKYFYFPFVGIVLMGISYGGLVGSLAINSSHDLLPILSLLFASVFFLLTGGIHYDGLMDTVDACFGNRKEIFKEPTVGAIGVFYFMFVSILSTGLLALCFMLATKAPEYVFVLFLIPLSSRLTAIWAIVWSNETVHFEEKDSISRLIPTDMVGVSKERGLQILSRLIYAHIILFEIFVIWLSDSSLAFAALALALILGLITTSRIMGFCRRFKCLNGDMLGCGIVFYELLGFATLAIVLLFVT